MGVILSTYNHWGPILQASQNPGSFFRDQFFSEPSSLRKTFPQKMSFLKFCTSSTKATFVTSLDTKGVKTLTLTGHTLFEGEKGNVVLLKRIAIHIFPLKFLNISSLPKKTNQKIHLGEIQKISFDSKCRSWGSGIQTGGSSPQRDM